MTMLTNIMATVTVLITTNVYQPTQYDCSYVGLSYPPVTVEKWCDEPTWFPQMIIGQAQKTRLNPDVRITEVREVRTLSFECEGKAWSAELSNNVLSTKRERRQVTTEEKWVEDAGNEPNKRKP